jgi:catalase (peroxidase I)
MIEDVKAEYFDASYADLIVLAGQTALEAAGLPAVDFCGGRVDTEDDMGSAVLGRVSMTLPISPLRTIGPFRVNGQ